MKKKIIFFLNLIRFLPHVLLMLSTRRSHYIWSDFERWKEIYFNGSHRILFPFIKLLSNYREFRNLFYYRLGWKAKIFSFLCRPMECLYIDTENIGPGFFIHHGFATIISAKSIGSNCWINQQVTVGYTDKGNSPPVIGDNVKIFCGAKVLGPVTIGDSSRIGANAVVVKDVPEDVTVVGVPARIVTKDQQRVDEKL